MIDMSTITIDFMQSASNTKKRPVSQHDYSLILQVAREEFLRHGFHTASLNQIISRAKISKGCFYHHFQNKQELFFSAFKDITVSYTREFYAEVQNHSSKADFWQSLALGLESFLSSCNEFPKYLRLSQLYFEMYLQQKDHKTIERIIEEKRSLTLPWLKEAIAQGHIRKDLEPDFILYLITGIKSIVFQWYKQNQNKLESEEILKLSRIILDFSQRLLHP
jgi:AcrR family transcriptional regulator